ncbi:MAG TPA: hypothetical protein VHG28_24050 [Longimicrobiaceae bacterium]|nr:hypothetical protein [Longimicrobiaceae bacterium]
MRLRCTPLRIGQILFVLLATGLSAQKARSQDREAMPRERPTDPIVVQISSRGVTSIEGNRLGRSSADVESVLNNLGRQLAPRVPEGRALTLRIANGEVMSSDTIIFHPQAKPGYDNYKKCVGDTWWAPVVAQVLCIPAFWY